MLQRGGAAEAVFGVAEFELGFSQAFVIWIGEGGRRRWNEGPAGHVVEIGGEDVGVVGGEFEGLV